MEQQQKVVVKGLADSRATSLAALAAQAPTGVANVIPQEEQQLSRCAFASSI